MANPTIPGEFEEALKDTMAGLEILPATREVCEGILRTAHKRELVAELEEVIKMIDHLQTPSNVKPTVQGRIQQLQQESNENE